MKTNKPTVPGRRPDLDWLRIAAVLLLVPFHSALIFVLNPESIMYIKDTTNSIVLDRMAGLVHQFHMPLLFFISGASAWFALQKRSSLKFAGERFSRLLLPAMAGIILLIPPMTYIGLIYKGVQVDFAEHFVNFWRINPADLAGTGGTFTPAHLWFLVFLYIFTMTALPVFLFLNSGAGRQLTKIIANLFAKPVMIFLFVVPLYFAAGIDFLGDKNPVYYFLVFFLGYFVFTDNRYQQAIDKSAPAALFIALGCEFLRQFVFHLYYGNEEYYTIMKFLVQLGRWSWVLAITGFGHRVITYSGKLSAYLSSAAFPFYLLHLPVNTLAGYLVLKLAIPLPVRYLLIVLLTIFFTLLICEAIKQIPFLRMLFGIKAAKRKTYSGKIIWSSNPGT